MRRHSYLSRIRKIIFSLLALALLTGCGKSEDTMEKIRTQYSSDVEFEAQLWVCAELSDSRQEYVLRWEHVNDSDVMTVLEPELISGLSARTRADSTELVYDDMVLAIEPSGTAVSPLEAVAELYRDWAEPCLDRGFELLDGENVISVTYSHEKRGLELRQRVWFDCASMKPLKAELYVEDRLTASFEFQLFDFK